MEDHCITEAMSAQILLIFDTEQHNIPQGLVRDLHTTTMPDKVIVLNRTLRPLWRLAVQLRYQMEKDGRTHFE